MTPEGKVKKKVNATLKALGADCWRFMPVQTGYGSPALDYLICYKGRFIAIETKAPGKKLTALQESTKEAIEAAGGIVLVVSDEDSLTIAAKTILTSKFAPCGPNEPIDFVPHTLTLYLPGTKPGGQRYIGVDAGANMSSGNRKKIRC